MMDLSKTLQEDIRNNQINLKLAIQNHQALIVKLRGNLPDQSEIKLKLAEINKNIISLGNAQKLLVARVEKEIASNNAWNNNNSLENKDGLSKPVANAHRIENIESRNPQATLLNRTKAVPPDFKEDESRKREKTAKDEIHDPSPPAKRIKAMLHATPRPSSPVPLPPRIFQQTDVLASSSDDSQESLTIEPSSEPSKIDFLSAIGLITREELSLVQSKHRERRRRRLAGQNSQYTNHWDLTVRRNRPRVEQDKDRPREVEIIKDESPATSPPIVEVKKEHESSSASPSPSPPIHKDFTGSSDQTICVICRKRGILSVCDTCSTLFHWLCLDKAKYCPHCQASQIGELVSPFNRPSEASVSKVLGDTSQPPTLVSSMEVIARYYKRNTSENKNNTFADSNDKYKKVNCWRREN